MLSRLVWGGYAYVAGDGLRVIDVSDPTSPHEVGVNYSPEAAPAIWAR